MLVSIYIILLVNEYVIDRTYVIIICDNRIIYLYIYYGHGILKSGGYQSDGNSYF